MKGTEECALIRGGLGQSAAALALGVTSRWLRDHPDAPRNADGKYPLPALIDWYSKRSPAPELSDELLERVLVAVEALAGPIESELLVVSLAALLRDLQSQGDQSLVIFSKELRVALGARADEYSELDDAAYRETFEEWRRDLALSEAHDRLRVVVRCERTGLRRVGRQWVDAPTPAGWVEVRDEAPADVETRRRRQR